MSEGVFGLQLGPEQTKQAGPVVSGACGQRGSRRQGRRAEVARGPEGSVGDCWPPAAVSGSHSSLAGSQILLLYLDEILVITTHASQA